ncbi:MAG: PIN domain nuclease [Actinobacteria bacterium]|nr:PIN domain nuclease [Actinomycetota bacterium]
MTSYIVDTSALTRLAKPTVRARLEPLVTDGALLMTAPVAFELRFAARNHRALTSLDEYLQGFDWLSVAPAMFDRALEVQGLASNKGQLRAFSLVDLLVAAAAETAGLTVLHYDADFDRITKLTGQPTEWVVRRGTADR